MMPTNNSLGNLLQDLRRRRGMSRAQLCERARLGMRTVEYWEAGGRLPRAPELESALTALNATGPERAQVLALLTTARSPDFARIEGPRETNPLSDPLPDPGDLMRAMRLRRGWSQEYLAAEMGVSRLTVHRWEIMRTYPTEESLIRVCTLLNAPPHESAALSCRRLSSPRWPAELSIEDYAGQCEQFRVLSTYGWSPLFDLSMLALKRRLSLLATTVPEALSLLASLETSYTVWLLYQERDSEAQAALSRATNVASSTQTPHEFARLLLNLQACLLWRGPGGARSAVAALSDGVCLMPETLRSTVYCDLALYTAILQQADEADYWLGQAGQTLKSMHHEQADENPYYRLTYARMLMALGKPIEAMAWLPKLLSGSEGPSLIFPLRLWSQALLAAEEKDAAMQHLSRMDMLLTKHEIPLRRRQWEALTRRL